MTEDILAEFRGNIYQAPDGWRFKRIPFVVIEVIKCSHNPLIKIKLLSMPKFKSCHN